MVWLRCCSVLTLLLSSRVLTRVDLWPPEWAALTPMSSVHRTTVTAFNETISEINDVCVDKQMLHREKTGAQANADLLHVRRLITEMIEHQSQLAMGCPCVEVMTEVGALSSRLHPEFSCHCKVDWLLPLDPECNSSVLSARVARVAQSQALRTTSK
jgi:hypothetical protein